MEEVASEYPVQYVKYHRGLVQLRNALLSPRKVPPEVIIIWGETGSGKSYFVQHYPERVDGESVYAGMYSTGGQYWFDGYDGVSDMLFDEFDSSKWNIQFMLRLLDRYPLQVPSKGGFVKLSNAKRIFLVSNIPPYQWYAGVAPAVLAAFHRRVSKTLNFIDQQTWIDVPVATAMQGTYVPPTVVSTPPAQVV